MPVDFGMIFLDGIQHTDVTNPMLEFLIFGDKRLPIVTQKICWTTSVGNEPIKAKTTAFVSIAGVTSKCTARVCRQVKSRM